MRLHVLDLEELPDHEQLECGPDPSREHDERRREPHEMVQPREERPVTEDLVDERIRLLLARQMDGQAERAGTALDLTFDGAGVGRLHETGAAAGDDVHAHPRQLEAELLHFLVDGIAPPDPRAAENRDAIVLDTLRLDLVDVVDRLPELVDGLVENVRGIGAAPLLILLFFAEVFELRSGGSPAVGHQGRTSYQASPGSSARALKGGDSTASRPFDIRHSTFDLWRPVLRTTSSVECRIASKPNNVRLGTLLSKARGPPTAA